MPNNMDIMENSADFRTLLGNILSNTAIKDTGNANANNIAKPITDPLNKPPERPSLTRNSNSC